MIKELAVWFKVYLVVSWLVIPVLYWLMTPLLLLIEGSLTDYEMMMSLLHAQGTSLIIILVIMFSVICETLYNKLRSKLCTK